MNDIKIPKDLDARITDAMNYFWNTRNGQIAKKNLLGVKDQGNRGAVTGGKQLDGFVQLIADILLMNGISGKNIYINQNLELPGYYRPNKKWDLLVIDKGELIIAIEFKSQIGPSFGNNFNNRTEEAMGTALDLWTAYREGVFGAKKAPWIGYFMILEDCKRSNEPVKIHSSHFPVLDEFNGTSYKERYEIFCNKLLLERQYSAVCFSTTSLIDTCVKYDFPKENLSFQSFITSMLGTVIAHFMDWMC